MQPLSGNQRPDLLYNSSDEDVSCIAPATENASLQIFFKCPTPAIVSYYKTLTFYSLLTRCTIPFACHTKRHLNVQMWSENVVFLTFLLRNVLLACFLNISTSKSGPDLVCFVHLDFEMCFAPQRRAFFHLSSGQLAPHPPL